MDENKKDRRATLISDRKILLTQSDPLKRLREFCKQGKYFFKIRWDKFQNGFMMEGEVTYILPQHRQHKILVKKSHWVEKTQLVEAKRVIAAILLNSLGLGVEDSEEDAEEDNSIESEAVRATENILNQVSQTVDPEAILNQMSKTVEEMKEGSESDPIAGPLLNMADGLMKQISNQKWGDIYMENENSSQSWADICANNN